MHQKKFTCKFCLSVESEELHRYEERGRGETSLLGRGSYVRTLVRCVVCRHNYNVHTEDLSKLYSGRYWEETYGESYRERYSEVMSLPRGESDNRGRVGRIVSYMESRGYGVGKVLDIGSGLGVFPVVMRGEGWTVKSVEPDENAFRHLSVELGIDTHHGYFVSYESEERYNLVTFNKVLEHIEEPGIELERALSLLESGGLVYVEVPDSEAALLDKDKYNRQEFFMEHYHIFSSSSLSLLLSNSGLMVEELVRIRESSGKYTLYAFASIKGG